MGPHVFRSQDKDLHKVYESRKASEDEIKNPALVAGGVYI